MTVKCSKCLAYLAHAPYNPHGYARPGRMRTSYERPAGTTESNRMLSITARPRRIKGYTLARHERSMSQRHDSANLVFGLTHTELKPIVAEAAGGAIASFEVAVHDDVTGHYGYSAKKIIPTVTYRTVSGKRGKVKLFVKLFDGPGPHEACHYEHLTGLRAPVPRLYGAIISSDKKEMIFLEFLRPVRDLHPFNRFMNDEIGFPAFLRAAARFNAVEPSDDYAALLSSLTAGDFSNWSEEVGQTLGRIWEHASRGDLGEHLQELCASARPKRSALAQRARGLLGPVSNMETGLTHNDFYPDSVGKREATGEWLLLDLESVGLEQRFTDVARWIGPPDAVLPRCFSQRCLAELYLDEYARCGANCPPLPRFLEETRLLWIQQIFDMLWFRLERSLDGRVDWTEDRDEGRRVFRADLFQELKGLLTQV